MSGDGKGDDKGGDKPVKPEPTFMPDEQSLLPGLRPWIGRPKKDWRKWEDGRGNKIDGPAFRGPEFTGKIVPPLVDPHGSAYREDSLQLVKDAKGTYKVIDWSLPADKNFATEKTDDRRTAQVGTPPLMGRPIYETRHSLERALLAMGILARKIRDKAAGLPDDPVQCKDLAGKNIFVKKLVLVKYARGKFQGHHAIIDTACDIAAPGRRLVLKKDATLKEAVKRLVQESKTKKTGGTSSGASGRVKYVVAGPPIAFSVPDDFGGSGDGRPWNRDQQGPTADSLSWDVTVDLYARTGKWCETARRIWAGDYPPELVEQCENYRQEFLEDRQKFYPEPAPADDDLREEIESHEVARAILEAFEGSYVAAPEAE